MGCSLNIDFQDPLHWILVAMGDLLNDGWNNPNELLSHA